MYKGMVKGRKVFFVNVIPNCDQSRPPKVYESFILRLLIGSNSLMALFISATRAPIGPLGWTYGDDSPQAKPDKKYKVCFF